MKKASIIIVSVACLLSLFAQDKLYIYKSDKSVIELLVSAIDSISFGTSKTEFNVYKTDQTILNYSLSAIDSVSFAASTDTVKINYSGTTATVSNPLASQGVIITQSGADVVVNSTLDNNEVTYVLTGTTTDGSFKMYNTNRFNLVLKGTSITNSDGPAINVQTSKRVTVTLADGTTNSLTDGTSYATSTEDQKAAFFSEGQLVFGGNGTLNVKSNSKHGICSDDYIQINTGNIVVTAAAKDGVHSKDYFRMNGGSLNVTATGDGVECETGHVVITAGNITTVNATADTKGIAADSTITISGGTINLTMNGDQSKGLKSKQAMNLNGGTITINTAGGVVLPVSGLGYDPSYCTAIKSSTNINIAGAAITVVSTGAAGKGISADGNLTVNSGTVNVTTSGAGATFTNALGVIDSYASSCLEADGNIFIQGGTVTATSSGTGSKGISADGNLTFGDATNIPVVNVTNTGTKFLVSGTANYTTAVYSEPKAIKSDGILNIANGTFTLSASQQGANAIDCDSILNITGGTIGITIAGNQSKGIKASRTMNLNGGNITVTATGAVVLELTAASKYDPSYCAAIKGDADINIGGATITITHTGAGGKGISSATNVNMTSGTVKITTSGGGTTYTNSLGTTDSYAATCLTCDGSVNIIGGSLTCSSSGIAGKGISADGAVTIGSTTTSPTVNLTTTGARLTVSSSDYSHPKTLVATGAVTIYSGTNTLISTDDGIHSETSLTIAGGTNTITASSTTTGVGEGIESKYIYITGGTNTITASNDGINATFGTVSGGTESNDGSLVSISGGTTYVTGADAIDSNGNFTMTGGVVFSNGPSSGAEEYCDVNGTCNINGGIFVGCSSSQMQKAPSTTSTQGCLFITTTLSTSTMYTIAIAGVGVVSFKPKNGGGACLVSAPAMVKGAAYVVYTGGSYSGGTSTNNLYLNGTFSSTSATSKKTGSLSTSSTVNSISF